MIRRKKVLKKIIFQEVTQGHGAVCVCVCAYAPVEVKSFTKQSGGPWPVLLSPMRAQSTPR